MIVLKVSQVRLKTLFSGSIKTIVLAILSTPFTTNAFATVVITFRAFSDAREEDWSDPQALLETYRKLIMKAIEACMLYPAILLNFLKARLQLDSGQNTVRS